MAEKTGLTSMASTPEAPATVPGADAKPAYSYGLRCQLGNDELKKLGIDQLPAPGEEIEAQVRFKVLGASTEGEGEEARHNVSLQITHMDLEEGEDDEEEGGEESAKKLFGNKSQAEGAEE